MTPSSGRSMSYWVFAFFSLLALAVFYGNADSRIFIYVLLLAAPLFVLQLAVTTVRSLFTRSAAIRPGPLAAAVAGLFLLGTYGWYYFTG